MQGSGEAAVDEDGLALHATEELGPGGCEAAEVLEELGRTLPVGLTLVVALMEELREGVAVRVGLDATPPMHALGREQGCEGAAPPMQKNPAGHAAHEDALEAPGGHTKPGAQAQGVAKPLAQKLPSAHSAQVAVRTRRPFTSLNTSVPSKRAVIPMGLLTLAFMPSPREETHTPGLPKSVETARETRSSDRMTQLLNSLMKSTRPETERARPTLSEKAAAVPTPSSTSVEPFPAMVVVAPLATSTARMRRFILSAT
jgi:hypothetical protein